MGKAFINSVLGPHPEIDQLNFRLDRLRQANESVNSVLVKGSDFRKRALAHLLTLGDYAVNIAITQGDRFIQLFDRINLRDPFDNTPDPFPNLQRYKQHLWLRIMLRDRLHMVSLKDTSEALSRLADDICLEALHAAGANGDSDLILFAMGKWGGRELNAFSDIDPVFFANDEHRSEESDRLVRGWLSVMGSKTKNEIYPVDLRLRPEGDSGPLAPAIHSLERYLYTRAAKWERIAYLRARKVNPASTPEWISALISDFLFGGHRSPEAATNEVSSALEGIHANAGKRDIKRSVGSIRDVEFLVASIQLREGKQFRDLQYGSILQLLSKIGEFHLLPEKQVQQLAEGYEFLRKIENALQASEGRAVFTVPEPETPAHHELAWIMGLDPFSFEVTLKRHRAQVQSITRTVLSIKRDSKIFFPAPIDPQSATDTTSEWWQENQSASAILRRLQGPWGTPLSLFAAEQFRDYPAPAEAFIRLESAIEAYGGPEIWLHAFEKRPKVLEDVSRILLHGRRLLDEANVRPYLWERIGLRHWPFDTTDLSEKALSRLLGDYHFHLGERFISGDIDAETVTEKWSRAVGKVMQHLASESFYSWSVPVALLAMGKLGGSELAPDADLDVMLICESCDSSQLSEMVRRGTEWLKTASLQGRFLLDTRLRPEGEHAPMVITLSRLEEYLAHRAQPWEQMALVRSRFIAGDQSIGEKALNLLSRFTNTPPAPAQIELMDKARKKTIIAAKARPGVLKIKKALGGMMDFEFASNLAGWFLQIGDQKWWQLPIGKRLEDLAKRTGTPEFRSAANDYRELRRWELVQSFSGGSRRGEIHVHNQAGKVFAHCVNIPEEEVLEEWQRISKAGQQLYKATMALLVNSRKSAH